MNTYALYGLAGAALGAVQMMAMFFLGLHGERIDLLNDWRVGVPLWTLGFAVNIAVVVFGLRAWREEAPGRAMSFGRGVGGGCLIGLWQGLGTMVFTILYGYVINPGFTDTMVAFQLAKLQERGLPAEGYAMAEKMVHVTMNPIVQGVTVVPMTVVICVLIALIASAVLKREPQLPPEISEAPETTG